MYSNIDLFLKIQKLKTLTVPYPNPASCTIKYQTGESDLTFLKWKPKELASDMSVCYDVMSSGWPATR